MKIRAPRFRYHTYKLGTSFIYDFKKNISYVLPTLKATKHKPYGKTFVSYLYLENVIEVKIKYPELFV